MSAMIPFVQENLTAIRFFVAIAVVSSFRALFSNGTDLEQQTHGAEKALHQQADALVDPLLVKSSLSPDGFQLRPGLWEFPGFCWSISTRVTNETPRSALKEFTAPLHSEAGTLATARREKQDSALDGQLLSLIHSMMSPTDSSDSSIIYEKISSGLRGAAICRRDGDREIPEFVCLQWPASGDLWTELSLRKRAAEETLSPIVALPAGSAVVSQRRGTNESIQYQAAEVPATPEKLCLFLVENGFRIRPNAAAGKCFQAESESATFEFTWQALDIDRISVLVRQL